MAAQSRGTSAAVSQQLAEQPYRFEFFQAVRLLERLARERARDGAAGDVAPVGYDHLPQRESVRFRALPSHTFPPSEVVSLKLSESPLAAPSSTPLAEMVVSFLGLTGPAGVLPRHYTQLVIDRVRQKDFSLRDFLDLFNHRAISLFYRAWEKYRLPAAFERATLDPEAEDQFTRCLLCLVGLGTDKLRGRLEIDDAAFLYYGGHFAHTPRTATALESILQDYFELPAQVLQFQGRWLHLSDEDRSRTPSPRVPEGQHCRLGVNVVVGRRVWSVENKFRVRLGPLSYAQFCRYLPRQDALRPLCQLVRSYVGPEFDFDVQPVLQAAEVPPCRAGRGGPVRSQLGWNTWLRSKPLQRDAADAIFQDEGNPD